jgi:hypothetical protein
MGQAISVAGMLLTRTGWFPKIPRRQTTALFWRKGTVMPRFCLTLVGLLTVSTVSHTLAQTAIQPRTQQLPSSGWTPSSAPPANGPAWNAPSPTPNLPPANAAANGYPPANTAASNVPLATAPASYPSVYAPSASLPPTGAPPNNMPMAGAPANGAAQTLPPAPPSETPASTAGEKLVNVDPLKISGSTTPAISLTDFFGYRYSENSLDWIPGPAEQFGMFSIVFDHYQKAGFTQGLGIGMSFNFLCGPVETDMPPILYDFSAAYQIRAQLGLLAVDVAGSVLVATDFKGNAGQGLQYPAHAVGYIGVGPALDLVFGVDYVDLGEIKILPVGGLIWKPSPAMRLEAVFPRPRAVFQLTDNYRFYVSGQLGGGSWSIERADTFDDDLATYRDLRVCIGIEQNEKNGNWSALEAGYLFNRRLEYSSGLGNTPLPDAAILRLVTRY